MINGFWIGLAIAAPVGPIGLLCMQRTLEYGRRYGIISGLGAATADFLYGLLALSGLSLIHLLLAACSNRFSPFDRQFVSLLFRMADVSK